MLELIPGSDLPRPGLRSHAANTVPIGDPLDTTGTAMGIAPVFFSVDRNSRGRWDTAVRSQWVVGSCPTAPGFVCPGPRTPPVQEQAADIFVAVTYTNPVTGAIVTTNLLFIDNEQLGLMGRDDLDALILMASYQLKDRVRPAITQAINDLLTGATLLYNGDGTIDSDQVPDDVYDHYEGFGFTKSLTYDFAGWYYYWLKVGFSVTSSSFGRFQTAVDYETRGLGENAGRMQQCGDIYYSEADPATNTNYLWYEETGLGGNAGNWTFPASTDLSRRPDELDGLDSLESAPPGPAARPGDANGDGIVDATDIPGFMACRFAGSAAGPCAAADMDGDGDVDNADLALFVAALLRG